MVGGNTTAQRCCREQPRATTSNKCYLDRSVQGGFGPAVVQQASDGDPIRQIVDEGHVVDEIMCFPDAQYDNGGSALRRHKHNIWERLVGYI